MRRWIAPLATLALACGAGVAHAQGDVLEIAKQRHISRFRP
jgi:hypothetical protein